MRNYNIDIKRNIRQLMKEHKPEIKQKTLVDITGLTQSNVSKCLSEEHKNRFTLDQLIAIADYFEVSLDSLIGRNLDNIKQKNATMQDIISALFELEKVNFEINIRQDTIEDCNPYSGETLHHKIVSHDISFSLNYLDNFLSEWKSARTMIAKIKSTSKVAKDMYDSWKKEKLNEAANISLDGSPHYDYLDFDIPDGAEFPFD